MTHAGGRPAILSDEVLAKIAELRALDLGYGTIAQLVGVSRSTVRRVLTGRRDGRVGHNSQVDAARGGT